MHKYLIFALSVCFTASSLQLNKTKATPALKDKTVSEVQAMEEGSKASLAARWAIGNAQHLADQDMEKNMWMQAVMEAGLNPETISEFGKHVTKYPRSMVEDIIRRKRASQRDHRYNFIGRISSQSPLEEEVARNWAIEFAKANFTAEKDLWVTTHSAKSWKPLGGWDQTATLGQRKAHEFARIQSPTEGVGSYSYDKHYWGTLVTSEFTLCPAGDEHFSFRGYEAALAGSICVIKGAKEDWTPTESTYPGSYNIIVKNPKKAPLEAVFKLLQYKLKDEELSYDQEVADHNEKVFIKYLTFIDGDQTPPSYQIPPTKDVTQKVTN